MKADVEVYMWTWRGPITTNLRDKSTEIRPNQNKPLQALCDDDHFKQESNRHRLNKRGEGEFTNLVCGTGHIYIQHVCIYTQNKAHYTTIRPAIIVCDICQKPVLQSAPWFFMITYKLPRLVST